MARPVALVDCNNFSCGRLFQPSLRGVPVVVLSNNDGCVIARSNEAEALGIVMGDPWHRVKARHAGSGIVVRSSNDTIYGDLSARVMRVLSDFTPELEIYSIDEAFGGFGHRLEAHARRAYTCGSQDPDLSARVPRGGGTRNAEVQDLSDGRHRPYALRRVDRGGRAHGGLREGY